MTMFLYGLTVGCCLMGAFAAACLEFARHQVREARREVREQLRRQRRGAARFEELLRYAAPGVFEGNGLHSVRADVRQSELRRVK